MQENRPCQVFGEQVRGLFGSADVIHVDVLDSALLADKVSSDIDVLLSFAIARIISLLDT
jgi:hypothetical protein